MRKKIIPLQALFVSVLQREARCNGYNSVMPRYTTLTAEEVMDNARAFVAAVKQDANKALESGFADGAAAFNVSAFNRQAETVLGVKFVTNTLVKATHDVLVSTSQDEKDAFVRSFTTQVAVFVAEFLCDVTSKGTKQRLFLNGVTADELMP